MSTERELEQYMDDGFLGISREALRAMRDSELIQWQLNNKPGSVLFELGSDERQRRMISHQLKEQYELDAKLSAGNERAMRFAAVVGVIGTLAGAGLGAFATFKTGGAQTFQSAGQPQAQAAPETSKAQSTPPKAPAPASK